MGFTYEQMVDMTWIEFDYYSAGYQRRVEHGLNGTRLIISSMVNLWSKKRVTPRDIIPLTMDSVNYEIKKETVAEIEAKLKRWGL